MFRPDTKIGALSTFLQSLDKLGKDGKKLRYFRGHSKQSFQLIPSIYRNAGWIANEATMLKELILRCPNDFAGALTTFQCLVKMQHYSLPTRLLDVTSNPLVALYFACETHENSDEDGEVIVFDYEVDEVKYFDSDAVSVISNLSRRPAGFVVPESTDNANDKPDDVVKHFNEQEAIKLLLHDIRGDKPYFLPKVLREDLLRVVCVKPLLDNPRIIRQEGAFLLYGCNVAKLAPATLDDQAISSRLIINRDEKRNLLEQLRTLGISRATLFPEIEQVATHVKQAYWTPRIDLSTLTPIQSQVFGALHNGNGLPYTVLDIVSILTSSSRIVSKVLSELQGKGAIELVGAGRDRRWKLVENLEIVKLPESDSGEGRPGAANG